jgi:hypothetical protein
MTLKLEQMSQKFSNVARTLDAEINHNAIEDESYAPIWQRCMTFELIALNNLHRG